MSKGKRLVSVPAHLLHAAIDVARSEGTTVGQFVEAALTQAVAAARLGYPPDTVGELVSVTHAHQVLGGAFVPPAVLAHLVTAAATDEPGWHALCTQWYDAGNWHGKYLKERFDDPLHTFNAFLKATRWDLTDVTVEPAGDTVKLRCISTVLTAEGTALLQRYVEGVLYGLGYTLTKNDGMKGLLILDFERADLPAHNP